MHSGSLASLQAAYQEVHNFAAFGGAGSKSMGNGLSGLSKSSGGGEYKLLWVLLGKLLDTKTLV